LKKAQLPVETVRALQQGAKTGDSKLDAVEAFAEAVIATRGAVQDADYQAFLQAGFNEAQAIEVILGISLATLCNFTNSLAGTSINKELQPYASGVI
jgi:alkylhydroperoxidase family enzyme